MQHDKKIALVAHDKKKRKAAATKSVESAPEPVNQPDGTNP
jgi:methylglyoxal synthase